MCLKGTKYKYPKACLKGGSYVKADSAPLEKKYLFVNDFFISKKEKRKELINQSSKIAKVGYSCRKLRQLLKLAEIGKAAYQNAKAKSLKCIKNYKNCQSCLSKCYKVNQFCYCSPNIRKEMNIQPQPHL